MKRGLKILAEKSYVNSSVCNTLCNKDLFMFLKLATEATSSLPNIWPVFTLSNFTFSRKTLKGPRHLSPRAVRKIHNPPHKGGIGSPQLPPVFLRASNPALPGVCPVLLLHGTGHGAHIREVYYTVPEYCEGHTAVCRV